MTDTAPKIVKPKRRRRTVVQPANASTQPSGASGGGPMRPRRQRRRRRRFQPWNPRRREITRAVKAELKREGLDGPKVSVQQKISSTFGIVGPNSTGNVELELNFFTHPALAKEANDGTAFGPLQALAAQYSLWKIKSLQLRFTPMVGASAVSGTVVRASLNLSQSPGGSNWSGLGTRIHVDMHPGQTQVFHLRADQVGGPRDGGWWFTDTNEEGSQSAGPIVEVHTLGQTKSTFQNANWEGPLFLVEGIGVWQFANYQVKPALGSLERREGEVTGAQIETVAGEPITMVLPETSEVALFMDANEPESLALYSNTSSAVGETIYQIVDVGAGLAEKAAPPPFSWLIKGGWWFVKKLLGRGNRAGSSTYAVYASLSDAQENKPAIGTGATTASANTTLLVTQINSPNVGPTRVVPNPRSGQLLLKPGMPFRLHSEMISDHIFELARDNSGQNLAMVPETLISGVARDSTGNPVDSSATSISYVQTQWWIGSPGSAPTNEAAVKTPPSVSGTSGGGYLHALYRLSNPRFTDKQGILEYLPPEPESGVNFCVLKTFYNSSTSTYGVPTSDNPYAVYGKVVASNLIQSGTSPPISMVVTLIKVTNGYGVENKSDNLRDALYFVGDNNANARLAILPTPTMKPSASPNRSWTILERPMPDNTYLLAVSLTNNAQKLLGVDIPTTLTPLTFIRNDSPIASVFPYNLVGQIFSATSVDTTLTYIGAPSIDEGLVEQLRQLNLLSFPSPGGFSHESCYHSNLVPLLRYDTDDESEDDEEAFFNELGNECITLPSSWSHLFEDDGTLKEEYRLTRV